MRSARRISGLVFATLGLIICFDIAIRVVPTRAFRELVVRVHPNDPTALLHLANARLANGRDWDSQADLQRAVYLYRRALMLDPQLWRAHLGLAEAFLYQSKPTEALAEAVAGTSLQPAEGEGHYWCGIILESKKDNRKAMAEFRRAVDARPSNPDYLWRYGSVSLLVGKWSEAQWAGDRLVALAFDDVEGHILLGRVFEQKHLYQEAQEEYRLVLQRCPTLPGIEARLRRCERRLAIGSERHH